jgi:hypothetical protein
MSGTRDGQQSVELIMGAYRGSSPLPMRPRRPGLLVFP